MGEPKKMRKAGLVAGLVWALAMAAPAAAQPADPLGLGEFGAYLNPQQARQMIEKCDAQTRELQIRLTAYLEAMRALNRQDASDQRDAAAYYSEWREAQRALAEAETHLANLRGAEAERFAATVVEPRRQKVRALENRFRPVNIALEDRLNVAEQRARSAIDLLRELRVSDERMASSSAEELIHDQSERCRRMRIWAQLGANR